MHFVQDWEILSHSINQEVPRTSTYFNRSHSTVIMYVGHEVKQSLFTSTLFFLLSTDFFTLDYLFEILWGNPAMQVNSATRGGQSLLMTKYV